MTSLPEGFHRPVPVHDLPAAGRPFHIIARAEECRELAGQFDLLAIDGLSAEGLLRPEAAGQRIRLQGRLIADVVQTCVVSLDPVPAHIDVRFERLYGWDVDEEEEDATSEEVFLDLAGELPVEQLTSDSFDLGAVAAEQLALELDPYPRKPGALFTGCEVGQGSAGAAVGPLHALSGWRNRSGSGDKG